MVADESVFHFCVLGEVNDAGADLISKEDRPFKAGIFRWDGKDSWQPVAVGPSKSATAHFKDGTTQPCQRVLTSFRRPPKEVPHEVYQVVIVDMKDPDPKAANREPALGNDILVQRLSNSLYIAQSKNLPLAPGGDPFPDPPPTDPNIVYVSW